MASVAQLVRAIDCGPIGRQFDSDHSPHADLAQLVEQLICNQ